MALFSISTFVALSNVLRALPEDVPPEQELLNTSGLLNAALMGEPSCEALPGTESRIDCLFQLIYGSYVLQKSADHSQTYGELLSGGLSLLLSDYGLPGLRAGPDDTFFDLGSGVGKLVIQAFLAEGVGRSVGIEISQDRHGLAVIALRKLAVLLGVNTAEQTPNSTTLAIRGSVAELRFGNINEEEDLSAATVAFSCSTCLSQETVAALTEKLRMELRPGTIVLSQKQLIEPHDGLTRIAQRFAFTSYDPVVAIHVYIRLPKIPFPPLQGQVPSDWVPAVVSALRAEFDQLRKDAEVVGELELREAFTDGALRSATSMVAVQRLIRTFGTTTAEDGTNDVCGCQQEVSPRRPWILSFADFVTMASHGVFEGRWQVIDHIFIEAFPELRLMLSDALTMGKSWETPKSKSKSKSESRSVPHAMQDLQCLRNSLHETALHLASDHNNVSLFESLLARMGPRGLLCADYAGNRVLHHLTLRSSPALLTWVVEYVSRDTALRTAVVNATDAMDQTALFDVPDVETLRKLMLAGPWEIDARNLVGQTALHVMQKREDAALVDAFGRIGANVSIPDPQDVAFEAKLQMRCASDDACESKLRSQRRLTENERNRLRKATLKKRMTSRALEGVEQKETEYKEWLAKKQARIKMLMEKKQKLVEQNSKVQGDKIEL